MTDPLIVLFGTLDRVFPVDHNLEKARTDEKEQQRDDARELYGEDI